MKLLFNEQIMEPSTEHDQEIALGVEQEELEANQVDPTNPTAQNNLGRFNELSVDNLSYILARTLSPSATANFYNTIVEQRNATLANGEMAALYYQTTFDQYELENQRLAREGITERSDPEINFEILRRIFRSPNARNQNNQLLPVFTQVINHIMNIDENTINYVDNHNNTILHMAARENIGNAVEVIVNHANYRAVNFANRPPSFLEPMTPIQLANQNIRAIINEANQRVTQQAQPIKPEPSSENGPANQKKLHNAAARRIEAQGGVNLGNQGGAYAHGYGPAAGAAGPSTGFGQFPFLSGPQGINTAPALPTNAQTGNATPSLAPTEAELDDTFRSPEPSREGSPGAGL